MMPSINRPMTPVFMSHFFLVLSLDCLSVFLAITLALPCLCSLIIDVRRTFSLDAILDPANNDRIDHKASSRPPINIQKLIEIPQCTTQAIIFVTVALAQKLNISARLSIPFTRRI
jgi:hypothetical protein